jgi:competence protein ComEA
MDRSAAPWRVLDDTPPGEAAPDGGEQSSPASPALPGLSWRVVAGLAAAALLAVVAFVLAATAPTGEISVDDGAAWSSGHQSPGSSDSVAAGGLLVVDVQGAVVHPGLQHLVAGSRVGDAIAAADGYGPRVDAERAGRELNLAALLTDGDRIVVPSRDDPPPSAAAGGGSESGGSTGGGGLVDLNSATASELDALPGIGPVTAQKIIDGRPYASVDDLRDRKVDGASTFEKLRDLVTVR